MKSHDYCYLMHKIVHFTIKIVLFSSMSIKVNAVRFLGGLG